jgi:uncharacterized membrane protein
MGMTTKTWIIIGVVLVAVILLWKVAKTLAILVLVGIGVWYFYGQYKSYMYNTCMQQQSTTGTNNSTSVCSKYQ